MFADKDNPIRCSKLSAISRCTARIYMLELMTDIDDEGGTAAQTGSLTHAGVAAFHATKGTLKNRTDAAWQAIAKTASKFPQAEADEVRLFITPYMADPRNINAEFPVIDGKPGIEVPVEFELPPHPTDSTQATIYVQGTFDQIRRVNGELYLYDLKTGKKTGWEMIHDYAVQLAAYAYGAKQKKYPTVLPAAYVIRNYAYRVRGASMPAPDGVFWAMPYRSWDVIDLILENVRLGVALIRNGEVNFNPGPHCTFCEFGGLTGCIPQWNKLIELGKI